MLLAPGRLGTSSPELGVPCSFADISGFAGVCEVSDDRAGYMPELSYGSHMFQDLVEAEIFYCAIWNDRRTLKYTPGLLAGLPHIVYPREALAYQAGCCALSGGGLFVGEVEGGPLCACAEGDGQGLVVYKELLGGPGLRLALPHLTRMLPGERFLDRSPMPQQPEVSGGWKFGMLKWLDAALEQGWDWSSTAYLGLAFD